MHEGKHGILDQTHDELEHKFGKESDKHTHGHDHGESQQPPSDLLVKIGAAIIVIAIIGLFLWSRL